MNTGDLSQLSMLDLFRVEVENQAQVLTTGLLALEDDPAAPAALEDCMRAAHSLKGAARIVGIAAGVALAHAMEDCFVAAQGGRVTLTQARIDLLLSGVDLLTSIGRTPEGELAQWDAGKSRAVTAFVAALAHALEHPEHPAGERSTTPPPVHNQACMPQPVRDLDTAQPARAGPSAPESGGRGTASDGRRVSDRVLRVTADHLDRLLGLAGESLVESRWLKPFSESLLKLKRMHRDSGEALDDLRELLSRHALDEQTRSVLEQARRRSLECQESLSQRLAELEAFDRRCARLSRRLYDEARGCRMRPFGDAVHGFPRMVRDVGRSLGKQVKLEIMGTATQVDRDVMEKLDAPLGHLLRNAVDHGIESPEERRAAGKPPEGVVRLEARHSAGALQIVVADDGRGIDLDKLRATVVTRNLTGAEVAARLTENELLEFLFLPGFTMKDTVTDISGRGVGLDAVQDMVKQVRGSVRVSSRPQTGTRFQLQLPLTLSVVRALLAEIGGEPYAFPLAYIAHTLRVPSARIELLEGRQHFGFGGRQISLVGAHQALECAAPDSSGAELAVIVVSDQHNAYGLVVTRFLGERELVVQPLDARLGKVKDISAAALMEDGSPVLIVDVEDMIRSVEKLASSDQLGKLERGADAGAQTHRKKILVVDDSLTVRELERKLLAQQGYRVEVAVDGVDGWNAVRTGDFDLLVTDVDMPRMDGIELVSLIRKDPHLKSLQVMIVSYKDREEDRRRGLEAGADYYLTKGSFHDDTLLQAVVDLIGAAGA